MNVMAKCAPKKHYPTKQAARDQLFKYKRMRLNDANKKHVYRCLCGGFCIGGRR